MKKQFRSSSAPEFVPKNPELKHIATQALSYTSAPNLSTTPWQQANSIIDNSKSERAAKALYRLARKSSQTKNSEKRENLNKKIKKLLISGVNVLQENRYAMTALHIAIDEAALDLLKILLPFYMENIDVDSEGCSPLYFAIHNYELSKKIYKQIVILLLENGADPHYRSDWRMKTPFELAQPYPELCKLIPINISRKRSSSI